ncbi:hypothetical protein [Flavobacterium soyae]|uniref:Uncharacterized protein n=1 Tax=Flavobacterium soyae TaxID=2903098 RepID=A0ABZ2UIB7_9FLAO|nr:hypothetical protein [Flavobacterium soyae]MCD9573471.1 hypothetical protein [Flavobacterium soyae]
MNSKKESNSSILNQKDWSDNLSEEELKEIEIGIEQAENNQVIDHEEVMKVFLKYKINSQRIF